MTKLCIYHGNCADWFSGAWVVRKALGDIEFHAGVYQNAPPDVTGKDVVLVDFSYKRAEMEAIVDRAASVLVLDHHKTAEADLKDLPGAQVVFDMDRAGSMIAWDFYFPKHECPALLKHIQDRDLWRFALRKTREIQASVFAYEYRFDIWDYLMGADLDALASEGEAIERKHFKDIRELVKVLRREMTIGGIVVPVASLPYTLTSDAGHLMATEHESKIGVCYWDTPDGRVFSLRSTDDGPDVSEIAKQYGGGGHKHASGFRVPYGHELTTS
jgi:uncharacterized protein